MVFGRGISLFFLLWCGLDTQEQLRAENVLLDICQGRDVCSCVLHVFLPLFIRLQGGLATVRGSNNKQRLRIDVPISFPSFLSPFASLFGHR